MTAGNVEMRAVCGGGGAVRLRWLLGLLLLLGASAEIDTCYAPLCDMHTGYFVRSANVTLIYLEDVAQDTQLCVSIHGIPTIHCSEIIAGWLELPLHLAGPQVLSFALHLHQYLTLTYYIHEIDDPPSSLAYVDLTSPAYGTIKTDRLLVHFRANSVALQQAQALDMDILEVKHIAFHPTFTHVDTQGHDAIEPGSFFYRMSAVLEIDNDTRGLANFGYTEFVLSPQAIAQHRRFASDYAENISSRQTLQSHHPQNRQKHRICIWGSDTLDGQKNIWLQQMKFMNKEEFAFTYVLTNVARQRHRNKYETHINNTVPLDDNGEFVVSPNGVATLLASMGHIKVVVSPFEENAVQIDELMVLQSAYAFTHIAQEAPDDGSPALGTYWDNSEDTFLQYVLHRLHVSGGNIDKISPLWCRTIFINAREHLIKEECNVVVYGNNRGFSSDFILVSLARALGIPTVTELLNLFVDPASIPDVIIAPSHYALEHSSVQSAINFGARGIVIQPGVDVERFSEHVIVPRNEHMHACRGGESKRGCIVIGFVGRLAIEKNPALFLLTAHALLQRCPFCRFIVIGDGALRSELMTLASMLEIEWAVEFRGWVGGDLPQILSEVDILVNPSLRAWSETFCIANVEAMALGIPLVTFAVGGIGEYVRSAIDMNTTCLVDDHEEQPCGHFSISDNAVIVHTPSPEVIALAVDELIKDESLRHRIGVAGKDVVRKYFHTARQMFQYENVYRSLLALL